jgi:ribosomal protein S15P/S13E
MKVLFLAVGLIIVSSIQSFSQMHDKPPHYMRDKLIQLENIKIIEVLDMDEETTLRFFSRRNELQTKMEKLTERADEIITQMEVIFKAGKVYTEEELKSLIVEANTIHTEIVQTKSDFINSLDDILTTEQITKLIIFERRFKDELKRAMFKGRKYRNRD